MDEEEKGESRYLFDVEACPDVDEHVVGVGELAFDVEGVGEGDEDGFFFCLVLCVSGLSSVWREGKTHCQTTTSPTGRRAGTP